MKYVEVVKAVREEQMKKEASVKELAGLLKKKAAAGKDRLIRYVPAIEVPVDQPSATQATNTTVAGTVQSEKPAVPLAKPTEKISNPNNQRYLSIISGNPDTLRLATGAKVSGEFKPDANTSLQSAAKQQAIMQAGTNAGVREALGHLSKFKQNLPQQDLKEFQKLLENKKIPRNNLRKNVRRFIQNRTTTEQGQTPMSDKIDSIFQQVPKNQNNRKVWDMMRWQANAKPNLNHMIS